MESKPLFRMGELVIIASSNGSANCKYDGSYGRVTKIDNNGDGRKNYEVEVNGSVIECGKRDMVAAMGPRTLPIIR